jgi:glycosyltransferase involved in cell wall biosynthesis
LVLDARLFPVKILALNPFHGGSHQAFLETWIRHSRHEFEVVTQPATRWKWRMRQSAVAFADECNRRHADQPVPDVIFTTDMLSLAEFRGLCPRWSNIPVVVYFHENQLTYPDNPDRSDPHKTRPPVDMQPAFSNFCSALAANAVWFNSDYHRQEYLSATTDWLLRMPDGDLDQFVDNIRQKSCVQHPGIELLSGCGNGRPENPTNGLPHIVWVGRWEHDKRPQVFFSALRLLKAGGLDFRLSVLGEAHAHQPDCFVKAQSEFADNIDAWGFQPCRADYERVLLNGDIVVSTAVHEFFGIAVVEAVTAGCCAVVPNALAYPEVLGSEFPVFHDGSVHGVMNSIRDCCASLDTRRLMVPGISELYDPVQRASQMDNEIERVAFTFPHGAQKIGAG